MARHCLWLAKNRVLTPGKRFLVEGDETEMHRKLVMKGEVNGLVWEWLACFCSKPDQVYNFYRTKSELPRAVIGDGELLVNTQCVIHCWDFYVKDARPRSAKVAEVLKRISQGETRRGSRNNRIRYRVIRADMVIDYSKESQMGTPEMIAENLAAPCKVQLQEQGE